MAQQVTTLTTEVPAPARSVRASTKAGLDPAPVWPVLRILLGLVFLWAFLDKMFALGFATGKSPKGVIDRFGPAAWIHGGSPTKGFLSFGVHGPFAGSFKAMAGNPVVDWLFMLGLLGVGLALVLGVALRPAAVAGILLLFMIRVAIWTPANNPLIDEHAIYIILLACMPIVGAGNRWGFGKIWQSLPIVRRHQVLA